RDLVYTSAATTVAIPCHARAHALCQRWRWPESGQLYKQICAGPRRRHVAGLHRPIAANCFTANRSFDRRNEILKADRPSATDIDDTIRRLSLICDRCTFDQPAQALDDIIHIGEIARHLARAIHLDRRAVDDAL